MSEQIPAASFPTSELAHALLHGAEFHGADWGEEAAVKLLVAHETWLHRSEFLAAVTIGGVEGGARTAWVDWALTALAVDSSPASGSERAVLRLACHLSGILPDGDPEHWSLAEILMPLDAENTLLASRAVAMAALGPDVVGTLE